MKGPSFAPLGRRKCGNSNRRLVAAKLWQMPPRLPAGLQVLPLRP